jgi:hypothetical protein
MSTVQKIKDIEDELARTQKNKATAHHIGLLKAKLAKYRRELMEPKGTGGSSAGVGFDVAKTGVASVGFIGFPSVGKSERMDATWMRIDASLFRHIDEQADGFGICCGASHDIVVACSTSAMM